MPNPSLLIDEGERCEADARIFAAEGVAAAAARRSELRLRQEGK